MSKYEPKYFRGDLGEEGLEHCYTVDEIKAQMAEDGIKEEVVTRAKADRSHGYFYCQEYGDIAESGESCGVVCEGYKPRNGKNGICKHNTSCHEPTDETRTIRLPDSGKKPRCHNCIFSGQQFKIDKLTHLHCGNAEAVGFVEDPGSPWETLRVFNDTCQHHQFKTVKVKPKK